MGEKPLAELKIQVPVEEEGFLSRLSSFIKGGLGVEPGGEPLEHPEDPVVEAEPEAEDETQPDEEKGMSLVKSESGRWLWFARYSNKYLDDDYPQEIIAEESHLNFVKEVREGKLDYPELWLHHIDGTSWGKALWVGYDNGFALAAGYVYPEHEDLAEVLASKDNMLLSHGMPIDSIVRDKENPHIILRHATKEISLLPGTRAANKLTGFVFFEEEDMKDKGISQEDRETLVGMGVPEEWINRQEQANEKLAQIASDLNMPSKAKNQTEVEEVDVEEEAQDAEEDVVEVTVEVLDQEMVDAIVESIKSINDRVDELASYVKSIKQEQDEITGKSTKASQLGILKSVIGSDAAQIDGRSSLAKSTPVENKGGDSGVFFWQKEGWSNGS